MILLDEILYHNFEPQKRQIQSIAPKEETYDVSIVMPCLNEELTLPGCIKEALEAAEMIEEAYGYKTEIVIGDNGSTDRSIEIAESMGARGPALFRHVYLPLTAPGIANGSVLVFVICLGFYVTPVLLGSPREQMAAGLIGRQIEEFLAFGPGSAMAMVLLVSTLIVLALYHRRFGLDKLYG